MRAYLIVPGGSPDALETALASRADALLVEGDVSTQAALRRSAAGPKFVARMGPIETVDEVRLGAIVAARPDFVALDAGHGRDIAHLGARLAVHEAEQGLTDGAIGILAMVARPEAVLQAASLSAASPRLVGVGWDAGLLAKALSADRGFVDGEWRGPLAQARTMVLLAAAAAGVEAVETAYPGEDAADCLAAIRAARRDGFAGMLARHPAQIAPIHDDIRDAIA